MQIIHEVSLLRRLVEQMANGAIEIPNFVRGPHWRRADELLLLNSIHRGIPVGPVVLWETHHSPDLSTKEPRTTEPVTYILDGRQRLEAATRALMPYGEENWRLYFDLDSRSPDEPPFLSGDNRVLGEPNRYLPMRCLLSTSEFRTARRRIEDDIRATGTNGHRLKTADQLPEVFGDYAVQVTRVRDADLKTAVRIADRLNHHP